MITNLYFKEKDFNQLVELYQATPKQVSIALKRTMRKGSVWLRNRSKRDVAQQLKTTQKAISSRFFSDISTRSDIVLASLWMGLDEIKAAKLGRLSQKPTGAQAGAHFFRGSFVARMPNGYRDVFYRTGKKTRYGRSQIKSETKPLIGDAGEETRLAEGYLILLQQYVFKTLDQELNYQVFVKNA